MNTSCFINALRRFFAIRGPAVQLRCDNGTNFVGARNKLNATFKEMDTEVVTNYLSQQQCEWILNPPHGSHCGGVWGRMIRRNMWYTYVFTHGSDCHELYVDCNNALHVNVVQELFSNQEEADTRLILHAHHASSDYETTTD
jgi:hypothetical protein